MEKFGVIRQVKPTSVLQEKRRKMNGNADFTSNDADMIAKAMSCRNPLKPLEFGKYDEESRPFVWYYLFLSFSVYFTQKMIENALL